MASLARRHDHFDFFDAYNPLCNNQTTTCSIYVPDTATVAYLDGMHLTRSGSLYLWPYLCSAVATLRGSSDRAPVNFAQEDSSWHNRLSLWGIDDTPLALRLALPLALSCVAGGLGLLFFFRGRPAPEPKEGTAAQDKGRVGWYDTAKLLGMWQVNILHSVVHSVVQTEAGTAANQEAYLASSTVISLTVTSVMPLFFFLSGLVSKAELTAAVVRRNVVLLLLPIFLVDCYTALFWQTNIADWPAYFTTSIFDGGILGYSPIEPGGSAGLGSRLLTTRQPWFLKVLFLMRVVLLPALGRMRPLHMLLVVICCWLAGYVYLAPSTFGPQNGSDAIAVTFYHAPTFIIGYLCQQTGLASAYISFCRRRPAAHAAIRCVAAAAFAGILLLACVGGTTLDQKLEVHCYRHSRDADFSSPRARLEDLGCVSLRSLNVALHVFATLFWLPIGEVPFISAMGRRTLMAYLMRSQVVPPPPQKHGALPCLGLL